MSPKMTNSMRLGQGATGDRFRVLGVEGGPGVQARLMGIGLVAGTEVEMIRNDVRGPVILGLRQSRIGLGRGMADRVRVEPVAKSARERKVPA